jgi:hypothetical protein
MKLITLKNIFLVCLLYSSLISLTNSQQSENQNQPNQPNTTQNNQLIPIDTSLKASKYLFMYRYPLLKNNINHKLNSFTYKNVLFTDDQIVYFESTNESDPAADENYDTTKYLITMRYEFLDLPCLGRSQVCTHSQFTKEFKPIYPEINFDLPTEIVQQMGDATKASEQCLLILLNPVDNVNEAAWLCHLDLKTILDLQVALSKVIFDANMKEYDFVGEYLQGHNTVVKGVMNLYKDKFVFNDMDKKLVIQADWKDVEPYAMALYLKEDLDWKGDAKDKPNAQQCLKLYRKSELNTNNADYFCASVHRNDVTRKLVLNAHKARFATEMYTSKINIRLHGIAYKESLTECSKLKQESIMVDSKMLFPLKIQVRKIYFLQRHLLVNMIKLNKLKKEFLANLLKEKKKAAIEKVSGGVDLCKRALMFAVDKEYLPLKGVRERFAWDMQNPYHRLIPKINIKIDAEKEGSVGKKILDAVAKMKGTESYFAEKIPESAAGEIPNGTALRKAWNTVFALRSKSQYKNFDELKDSCKVDDKNNSKAIRRKISYLMFAGDNDVFFEYLGFIRDFQLTKK